MKDSVQPSPSVLSTLLLLVGIVVFMAGLLSVYAAAGISQPAFGYMFLLYWAAMLHQAPNAYLETVLGGVGGILVAVFIDRSLSHSAFMMILQYSTLALALAFYMRRQFTLFINNAFMLYMMVATIPALDCTKNYKNMIGALLLGALYMGVVSLVARPVKAWLAGRAAAAATDGAVRR